MNNGTYQPIDTTQCLDMYNNSQYYSNRPDKDHQNIFDQTQQFTHNQSIKKINIKRPSKKSDALMQFSKKNLI